MEIHFSESQRRRTWRRRRIRFYVFCGLIFILFASGFIFLRTARFFSLQRLDIGGVEGETRARLLSVVENAVDQTLAARLFGKDHYFSWLTLTSPVMPELASLHIKKNLFSRSISIDAEPRARLAVWCGGKEIETRNCFWFDERDGVLFEETLPSRGQLITTIEEEDSNSFALGSRFLSESEFANTRGIIKGLERLNLAGGRLVLSRLREELTVVSMGGAILRFSIRFDPQEALAGLEEFARRGILKKTKVADFTVEHKIYLTER